MTSLFQGMDSHCNDCIAFKNAVCKYDFQANDNACQLHECFHNGFWAIMTSKVCFENFYGKAFGTLI